jgi:hypothetical protein
VNGIVLVHIYLGALTLLALNFGVSGVENLVLKALNLLLEALTLGRFYPDTSISGVNNSVLVVRLIFFISVVLKFRF